MDFIELLNELLVTCVLARLLYHFHAWLTLLVVGFLISKSRSLEYLCLRAQALGEPAKGLACVRARFLVPARTYKGQGIGREIGDWILFCGVIPHQAAAQKTLDGVPIRFFVLKIIFRILVDLCGVRDQAATA